MRELIGMRLFESGSSNKALNIGLARTAVATSANVRNTQHIRHHQIGNSEAVFDKPFAFAQYGLHVRKPTIQPAGQAIFTIPREPEEPPRNGENGLSGWLDSQLAHRSEEHTSELQSRGQLVCRPPPDIK